MKGPVISKFLFTLTFPRDRGRHVPLVKMRSLARSQLPDLDIIETIDHLFKCTRCLENYRHILRGEAILVGRQPPIRGAYRTAKARD